MARRHKRTLPRIRYPRGRKRSPDRTSVRTYHYRYRQTSRGRVPVTPEDRAAMLEATQKREQDNPEAEPEA